MSDGYACTRCGREEQRDNLTQKKVQFGDMGQGGVRRSRTVAWLCDECLVNDADYNFPKHMSLQERMARARSRRTQRAVQEA